MKIELLTSHTCPHCPRAVQVLKKYCKEHEIRFIEIDSSSKKGKKWSRKFSSMSVPSFAVFGSLGPVFKSGVPTQKELDDIVAISNGEKEMPKPFLKRLFEKLNL